MLYRSPRRSPLQWPSVLLSATILLLCVIVTMLCLLCNLAAHTSSENEQLMMETKNQVDPIHLYTSALRSLLRPWQRELAVRLLRRFHAENCRGSEEDRPGRKIELPTCSVQSADATCQPRLTRMLRHLSMLQLLQGDPGIVQLRSWCITMEQSHYTIESGQQLHLLQLLQLPWENRLRVVTDVSSILSTLHRSPIGSLGLKNFQHSNFAFINSQVKLTNVDSVDHRMPNCTQNGVCTELLDGWISLSTRCEHNKCVNHHSRANIRRADNHYFKYLLRHSAPPGMQHHLRKFHRQLAVAVASGDMDLLMRRLSLLIGHYGNGEYLRNSVAKDASPIFIAVQHSTINQADYVCQESMQPHSCSKSAFNLNEAKEICWLDRRCSAIVMTQGMSWTNRTLFTLKTGTNHTIKPFANHHVYFLSKRL